MQIFDTAIPTDVTLSSYQTTYPAVERHCAGRPYQPHLELADPMATAQLTTQLQKLDCLKHSVNQLTKQANNIFQSLLAIKNYILHGSALPSNANQRPSIQTLAQSSWHARPWLSHFNWAHPHLCQEIPVWHFYSVSSTDKLDRAELVNPHKLAQLMLAHPVYTNITILASTHTISLLCEAFVLLCVEQSDNT